MLRFAYTSIIALAIGGCGGAVFKLLHVPLPWTLGSLTASAIAAIWFNRWPMPLPLRNMARPVVGVLAGAGFTPEIVGQVPDWWSSLLFVAVYSFLISVVGYFAFTRLCKFDKVTSYFAAAPGGLGELTIMGGSFGGSMRTIVLIHLTRVVTVVFGIPILLQIVLGHSIVRGPMSETVQAHNVWDWLIMIGAGVLGYILGMRFKTPGGVMVAAMLCSAAVHSVGLTRAAPPAPLIALVQVLIGSVAGSRFAGLRWAEVRTTAIAAVTWSVTMLATAAAAAKFGSWLLGESFEPLLLAMAPGGTAEMVVITYAIGGGVAFVSACQLSRVLLVLTFAPIFFRLLKVPPPVDRF